MKHIPTISKVYGVAAGFVMDQSFFNGENPPTMNQVAADLLMRVSALDGFKAMTESFCQLNGYFTPAELRLLADTIDEWNREFTRLSSESDGATHVTP